MRNRFADELVNIANKDERVVLLYGDIGNRLFDEFKEKFPFRHYNCGVAEANMVGVAAGMARQGFRPYVYTINTFLYLKAFEQIKLDVCYADVPVVLVGTGSGLSYSELGTTHHSLEDLGVLRQLPNLQLLAPNCPDQLSLAMEHSLAASKPIYIRIGKKGEKALSYLEDLSTLGSSFGPFVIARTPGAKAAILSTGTIAHSCQEAIAFLREQRMLCDHFGIPQISPVVEDPIIEILSNYSVILTVEEHNSNGALSSVIEHLRTKHNLTFAMDSIGTPLTYHVGLGDLNESRNSLGLSAIHIARRLLAKLNDD